MKIKFHQQALGSRLNTHGDTTQFIRAGNEGLLNPPGPSPGWKCLLGLSHLRHY